MSNEFSHCLVRSLWWELAVLYTVSVFTSSLMLWLSFFFPAKQDEKQIRNIPMTKDSYNLIALYVQFR